MRLFNLGEVKCLPDPGELPLNLEEYPCICIVFFCWIGLCANHAILFYYKLEVLQWPRFGTWSVGGKVLVLVQESESCSRCSHCCTTGKQGFDAFPQDIFLDDKC